MELLEVYRCPEFIYPVIYAAKFKHVKNAGAIRERIVKASTMEGPEGDKERDAVNFAFINAKLVSVLVWGRRRRSHRCVGQITSPLHLQTAAMQALFAQSAKTMRTKTPHSEIIWNLNPTNNVRRSVPDRSIPRHVCDATG